MQRVLAYSLKVFFKQRFLFRKYRLRLIVTFSISMAAFDGKSLPIGQLFYLISFGLVSQFTSCTLHINVGQRIHICISFNLSGNDSIWYMS